MLGIGGLTVLTALYAAVGIHLFDNANLHTIPDEHLPLDVAAFDFLYLFTLLGSAYAGMIILQKAGEIRMAERLHKNAPNF